MIPLYFIRNVMPPPPLFLNFTRDVEQICRAINNCNQTIIPFCDLVMIREKVRKMGKCPPSQNWCRHSEKGTSSSIGWWSIPLAQQNVFLLQIQNVKPTIFVFHGADVGTKIKVSWEILQGPLRLISTFHFPLRTHLLNHLELGFWRLMSRFVLAKKFR